MIVFGKIRDSIGLPHECCEYVRYTVLFIVGETSNYVHTVECKVILPSDKQRCMLIDEETVLNTILRAGLYGLNGF